MKTVDEQKLIIKKKNKSVIQDNLSYTLMALPVVVKTIIFSIVPLLWIGMAFQNYRGFQGIFGSEWVGFEHFINAFSNPTTWKYVWNTVGLNVMFIAIGTPLTVVMALFMYEMSNRTLTKLFQTIYFIPYLISWTVAQWPINNGVLGETGIINSIIVSLGGAKIDFYSASNGYMWPWILLICNIWKGQGYSVIMYYASLQSLDTEMLEAADLDGANRFQKMWYISLAHLRKMIGIMLIMSMGGMLRSDFGLFWFIPDNDSSSRPLFSATGVLDTYMYQLIMGSAGPNSFSIGTAVGLVQSVVGMVVMLVTNWIVKKLDENAAFI